MGRPVAATLVTGVVRPGMAKRKTLPKDFEELLEKSDLAGLQAVFDQCEVDARGGYAKQTALAFDRCPDELARWLVSRGADLSARDNWRNTPLHSRARSYRSNIDVLLELGADVNATGPSVGTPLHAAAENQNALNAAKLVAHRAQVDARNQQGLTPLELALRGCVNAKVVEMVQLAKVLLAAGAERTPIMSNFVTEIGKRFEFHRARFDPESVGEASAALEQLYALFEVPPVPRRVVHDGKATITVKTTRWQQQHAELWNLLVPSSGPAATVQGEVIRIAGRLGREVLDNGACNWDEGFREMARALLAHVQTLTPLTEAELEGLRPIIRDLERRADGDLERLTELAVAWVLRNPNPVPLPKPSYQR